ncbi:MAG: hypothetical protein IJU04_00135 [Ruminococcus sp.]|nr:hypothetical protein [Ruminococcus sp.]
MQDNVHLCLSDLLDQDISSNEFFQTLSPAVQRQLMKKDIRTFEELQRSAKAFTRYQADNRGVVLEGFNPGCSVSDCTGLIPQGSNLSEHEYKDYQKLYDFGNPYDENKA